MVKTYGGVNVQILIFLTSALVAGEWSFTPRPLYPRGKSPLYPFDRRLGGPQTSGEKKNPVPTGTQLRPSADQPVASRYTDCAIPAVGDQNLKNQKGTVATVPQPAR
jgi:hypothetical protein